jgi:60 kDa SS-A/Ro ribonucleoprotein
LVAQFESFKAGDSLEVPDLPFTMLSALPLSKTDWAQIARKASWQTTRMNLNTFLRHGVFEDESLVLELALRLSDPEEIKRARVFPYQLLTAYQNCDAAMPQLLRDALQDAMELAIQNVPQISGSVVVCPDVSGSMSSPVTGHRTGSTSAVRCIDVAALVGAAVLRKNPSAMVVPFEETAVSIDLNSRDSVMTNAAKLAAIGGGGTNCSAPLALLNQQKAKADLVIFVSDNESWVDATQNRGTALMAEWARFRQRNPQARLVCLDIQPYTTTQAAEREDILNVGGFSDQVFELISAFAAGELEADHLVGRIESIAA